MEQTEAQFTDGNGNPVSLDKVSTEIYNYRTFKEACKMVDQYWTVNYFHKQYNLGRIRKSQILVTVDKVMQRYYKSADGKTYYIHVDEIERFKEEEYPKIKQYKRKEICTYCRKKLRKCLDNPCSDRRMRRILDERERRTYINRARANKTNQTTNRTITRQNV